MAKVLLQSTADPLIEILSGPKRGATIPLTGAELKIGRSEDNDIVFQSESVSRNHALLAKDPDRNVSVSDNGSKNGVLVNGIRIEQATLSNGDVVQIGDFVFRFQSADSAIKPKSAEVPAEVSAAEIVVRRPAKRRRAPGGNRRLILYTVLIGFLALAYWLSTSEEPPPKAKPEAQSTTDADTPRARDRPAGLGDPELKRVEQDMSKLDWSDSSVREAEQYFRRGTREYLNRNFHRAIEAFQTALQLDKNHAATKKYIGWAISEVETEAKRNRDLGVRYFESLQYQRAIFHFQEVVALMAHRPADPLVGQAEKYIELSKRALEAADFFP